MSGSTSHTENTRSSSFIPSETSAEHTGEHSQTYKYQPLSGPLVVRVAEVHQGEYGTPLTLALKETKLPDGGNGWAHPEYQTLSYEWGQSKRNTPINCDGKILLITKNLEAALQHLRPSDKPLSIWIDSICIDQENPSERSHQVSLMALIYKSSPRVNMWLGEENAVTQEGISMLGKLNDLYDQLKKRLKSSKSPNSWLDDSIMSTNHLKKILGEDAGIEEERQECWSAVDDILGRSYFERTWITQELLLSWNATVIIGTLQFPWRLLRNAALITKTCFCLPVNRESLSYWRVTGLAQAEKDLRRGAPFTITKLLQNARISCCRDARDMIYATYGMLQYPHGFISKAKAAAIGLPVPDYTKSVEQVYQDTAAAIITKTKDLGLFFNLQVPSMRSLSSMPTWVVDWSPNPQAWGQQKISGGEKAGAKVPVTPTALQKLLVVRAVPHAIAPIFPSTDISPITIAGRVLTAPGLSLGDVKWTSDPLRSESIVHSLAELQKTVDEKYENTFFDKYITDEPIIQALCKTILMGDNDAEAAQRGFDTTGTGGWTPMFESFFGTLVIDQMMKRMGEIPGIPERTFWLMCVKQTGAGLFLSAARSVANERFFQTDQLGLMGIGALDIKAGDRVVWLRGAYAPVVMRRVESGAMSGKGDFWEIVCEAYVHGAMENGDKIFEEGLCREWDTYKVV